MTTNGHQETPEEQQRQDDRTEGRTASPRQRAGARLGAINDEQRRHSFEVEDQRWSNSWQRRDWLIVLLMMAITIGWMALPFLFEPGLRSGPPVSLF